MAGVVGVVNVEQRENDLAGVEKVEEEQRGLRRDLNQTKFLL